MEYEFTLTLDRDPNQLADELYEAGLDDATIGTDGPEHRPIASFVRDAASFWDAVTSAVADVQKTPVRVLAVEGDRLLTGVDISEEISMSRQHVDRLRSHPDFPDPVQRVGPRVVLYSRNAVLAWAWATDRLPKGPDGVSVEPAIPSRRELVLVEALNAALAWRARAPQLDAQSRKRVEALAA